MLIDAGWAGNNFRDANRIAAAAKLAKVKKIDYFILTHYHADHVGGVPQLVQKLPVGTFIDHGPTREHSEKRSQQRMIEDYTQAVSQARHLVVKPGDKLPVKGIDATVVSADGNVLPIALTGAGDQNPYCEKTPDKETDKSEKPVRSAPIGNLAGSGWSISGI